MLPAGFVTTLILLAPAYFESERQAMRILTASHFPAAHVSPFMAKALKHYGSKHHTVKQRRNSQLLLGHWTHQQRAT